MKRNQQAIAKQLIAEIEDSITGFNKSIPELQQNMLDEVTALLKDLEIKNGRILGTAANLKQLVKIKLKIDKLVNSPEYRATVKDYIQGFNKVVDLQNEYFESLTSQFKPNKLLAELQVQSVDAVVDSLTDKGMSVNVSGKIADLLRKNITTGAKYTDLVSQLTDYIVTNDKGAGVLERYTKQITTDALNQFSAQYTNAVTIDLGLEWFMYDGPIVDGSRVLCEALVKKKYIHRSELPDIVLGKFKEFRDLKGKINSRTNLPEGMIDGTTADNFHIFRGGYSCGHQLIPVAELAVPRQIRVETYTMRNIPYDAQGLKVAA